MEDLKLVLSILGALAIIGVLVHGFWSIRKQQPKSMKESPMAAFYKDQSVRKDSQGFDADGIGAVRIRKASEVEDQPPGKPILKSHAAFKAIQKQTEQDAVKSEPITPLDPISTPTRTAPKISTKVQSNQQALFIDDIESIDEDYEDDFDDIDFAHKSASQDPVGFKPTDSVQDTAADVKQPLPNKKIGMKTPESMIDAAPKPTYTAPKTAPTAQAETKQQPLGDPTDVLVLHLVAKDGEMLHGAELLPSLLTLNFKFGDMEIFHRHIDNAGNGKVLFSLANMMKPGVFDPDNMEQFTTQGVVLFMTLPCFGDPMMNFTIMLNSALQLAEDLDAELLDGKRMAWNDATRKEYERRIRIA